MGWAGLCGALFSTVTTADVVLQHAEQSSITMDDGKDAILGGSGCISIAEGRVVAILGGIHSPHILILSS